MQTPHQLAKISKQSYLDSFDGLYEHSPWVVLSVYEQVQNNAKYTDLHCFHQLLSKAVLTADADQQDDLIKQHPMLAVKRQEPLTDFSADEQKSAGLASCTEQEAHEFAQLNQQYMTRFGFPFIMAVKGRHKTDILAQFEKRLVNNAEHERQTALDEINKIAWIRLQALYGNDVN